MSVKELLEKYESLPAEAQRQVADYIAFLRERYGEAVPLPTTSEGLEREPFIGMWEDRNDLSDSTSWVRRARKTEWSGEHETP